MNRLITAIRSCFSILLHGRLPEDIVLDLGLMRRGPTPARPSAKAEAPAVTPADGAVQMLALLQREARLVDFLQEDIAPYTDEQVGAAVRDVHQNCRAVLQRHFTLAPVIDGVEGAVAILASSGVDPKDAASIKLLGNVPPNGKVDSGVLRHRGWKVDHVDLPLLKPGKQTRIVAPAEVEVE